MAIDSQHPEYKDLISTWNMVRDCTKGSKAIKARGDLYLPFLTGQDSVEYEAYKKRALFYEATSRTLQGLVGSVFRKAPAITAPESFKAPEGWLMRCTAGRKSIDAGARRGVREALTTGKFAILVDAPKSGVTADSPLWFAIYSAESIINWRHDEQPDGRAELGLVVIEEYYDERTEDDYYEMKTKCRWVVMEMVGEGTERRYRIQVWKKVEPGKAGTKGDASKVFYQEGEDIYPSYGGRFLDFIPMVIVTAADEETCEIKPPLEPVATVNVSHYQSSADAEHGAHYTALPTPYVTGAGKSDSPLKIGSQTAWMISEVGAKVGMMEFSGAGLGALDAAMERKEKMMAVLGARLLEEPKKSVEAADTHAIRKAGEESVLASIARAVSEGFNKALVYARRWDPTIPEITIELNREYGVKSMDSASLQAIVAAWQSGAISYPVLFHNLESAELYPEGHTQEDEENLRDQEAAEALKNLQKEQLALGGDEEDEEDDNSLPRKKKKAAGAE